MNTTDLVHFPFVDAPTLPAIRRPARAPSRHELAAPVRSSIFRARQYLVGRQRLDGSWAGQRSGDISALSQLVLLYAYLGRERSDLVAQAARAISRDQRPEGGWSLTPGGPIDLSASVLAYFSLKIVGEEPSQQHMVRARRAIRASGGADAVDVTTRFWLAPLGQIDFDSCPPIAPERLLMPACLGDLTAAEEQRWAALSVVSALRPVRKLELVCGVRELFILPLQDWPAPNQDATPKCLAALAMFWSTCDRIGWLPFRRRALDRASCLLAEPAVETDHREANFDELAWQRIALEALGFGENSPALAACERRLKRLVAVDAELDEARSQPETSLTADTALAIAALHTSGLNIAHPAVSAGVHWLMEHRVPRVREHHNTREQAAILQMFVRISTQDEHAGSFLPPDIKMAASRRARHGVDAWHRLMSSVAYRQFVEDLCKSLLTQQRPDGGWSPDSDVDANPRSWGAIRFVARRPTTSSSPDATGAMLEMLSSSKQTSAAAAIRRATEYLRFSQRGDGSWDSASGSRFLYGTTWAIRGLVAAGATSDDPAVAAGVNWLLVQQQQSGGWGETDASAIQTAWAVLALVAAGQADHDATRRAIQFLVDSQQHDGNWSDRQLTERDSAAGCWYRNDLHAAALPSMALAHWAVSSAAQPQVRPAALRLISDESRH